MRLILFIILICTVCVYITPALAAVPYFPAPTSHSAVPFSATSSPGQDASGVIAAGLIVVSTPPGGEVSVDGSVLGTTPCTLPGLSQGIHIVTIRMNGYMDWTRSVMIRDRHTVNLNAVLVPSAVTPVPTVTPKPTLTHPSITPLGTPVPLITTFPTINPKPTVTHPSITPLGTPIPGPSVQIVSNPPGGAVVIDGITRGATPCTLSGLSNGIHIITVKSDGYREQSRIILIRPGELKVIKFILVPAGSGE